MKTFKLGAITVLIILSCTIMYTVCAPTLSIQFGDTALSIRDLSTSQTINLTENQTKQVISLFDRLQFKEERWHRDGGGGCYLITGSVNSFQLSILRPDLIRYEGKLYYPVESQIDLTFIDQLFYD